LPFDSMGEKLENACPSIECGNGGSVVASIKNYVLQYGACRIGCPRTSPGSEFRIREYQVIPRRFPRPRATGAPRRVPGPPWKGRPPAKAFGPLRDHPAGLEAGTPGAGQKTPRFCGRLFRCVRRHLARKRQTRIIASCREKSPTPLINTSAPACGCGG
jgi:hypothetical protein